MELDRPRSDTGLEQTLTVDETTGVLSIGWTTRPTVNLGSSLGFKRSASEAAALAAALTAFSTEPGR